MMTGTKKEPGAKVTVIGLGSMGAALAGALQAKGFEVTVWNRDPAKAAPLVRNGATLASGPGAAIEASPVTVLCVSDYKASSLILDAEGVAAALKGRTLLQLSTGTPKDARTLHVWVHNLGGRLLNGDIAAWPRQMGTAEAFITVSGSREIFEAQEELLQALAGNVSFVSEEPGASGALFAAALAYLAGNWIGFCYGALICEKEGLPVNEFGQLMESFAPMLGGECRHMGEVIHHGRFKDPESTVNTTGLDLQLLLQHTKEAGLNTELPELAADIFKRAMDTGLGGEEHAAIIKVLRKTT